MPWDIKQNFGSCNGYAVVKRGTTEIEGCHSSKEAAQRQMSALYASETEKEIITSGKVPNRGPDWIGRKKRVKKNEEEFDFSKLNLSDIDLKPSESMANNARRGLEMRRQYGRGGTEVGVARARDLANRKNLSPETVGRMYSYFSRHEVDKKGKGWSPGSEGYPSNGRIAWLLWGGDSGFSWAKSKWSQIQRARMNKEDAEKKLTEVFLSNMPREARRPSKDYAEVYFKALTEEDK